MLTHLLAIIFIFQITTNTSTRGCLGSPTIVLVWECLMHPTWPVVNLPKKDFLTCLRNATLLFSQVIISRVHVLYWCVVQIISFCLLNLSFGCLLLSLTRMSTITLKWLSTGTWSNYPYFTSGNVAVQSIEKGLFLLKVGSNVLLHMLTMCNVWLYVQWFSVFSFLPLLQSVVAIYLF